MALEWFYPALECNKFFPPWKKRDVKWINGMVWWSFAWNVNTGPVIFVFLSAFSSSLISQILLRKLIAHRRSNYTIVYDARPPCCSYRRVFCFFFALLFCHTSFSTAIFQSELLVIRVDREHNWIVMVSNTKNINNT